jgi:chemosensory pili system protein ChpA (sensor histidine kinase/response regulator)
MAALSSATFDLGPLSWVKNEIEHSLTEARTHLDALAADPADNKAAKFITTHLHQVTGALSMVGLGAATRFNEEVERLVATLEDQAVRAELPQRIAAAKGGIAGLSAYLDNLMAGAADRPMMLSQAYIAVNRARGAKDATESDLFSPDLSVAVPMPEDTIALPTSDALVEAIKHRRNMYQAGLLKLLRDKDLAGGARDMRNATVAIEALQVTSPTRSFWYTASGFFDAVAANPGDAGALAVQLFGKIDQQIKLLLDGVQKVPERLFRDILLVIGKSSVATERIQNIRELYRLDSLLALPDAVRDGSADEKLAIVLRSLRDRLQSLKDHWLKFSSGNRPALEPFFLEGDALDKEAQQQPNKDLTQLFHMLAMAGAHLRKSQSALTESQGLEVATALLFAESALENYFRLSPDFGAQVTSVNARVKGAMTGAVLPALDPNANALMDDMTRRAQERMLMFQVGQEVQVNLSTIEAALDGYFRDASKTSELSPLLPLFSQVQGALAILELDEAAALNQLLRERVSQFASGALRGTGEDAEAVAEGVSALGLYVTALQQGVADPRQSLLPALIRFGLAAKPAAEQSALKSPISAADVDVAKQKVHALYEDWKHQPEATATRDQLRDAVKELKQEAELIADTKSAKQSEEILKVIDATFDPMKSGVSEALQEIAPEKPTEAPTAQTVQLMDAPTAEIDQELLSIFLEEATEVVGTIRENLAVVRDSPHDREALTTIRRGYHTLKGSGRMVGLTDLGEVAWSCEQVFNKWLKEEKPASASLMQFVDKTSGAFNTWVGKLQTTGTAQIDGSDIARMAELLKNDKELEVAAPAAAPIEAPLPVLTIAEVPATAVTSAAPSVLESLALPSLDLTPLPPAMIEPPPIETPAPALVPFAAEAAPSHEPELPMAEVPPPLPPVPDVSIGPVTLPAPFFDIYMEEAKSHATTLDNEMLMVEANPQRAVSHEFMRAAHTLTSSSRTTGFEMIADVSHALEKWLQDAIDVPPAWTARQLSVSRQSVDAVNAMVRSLVTHEWPISRPDLAHELTELRAQFAEAKRVGEGTAISSPLRTTQRQAPLDETAAPAIAPVDSTPAPMEMVAPPRRAPDDFTSDFDFFDEPPPVIAPPPLPPLPAFTPAAAFAPVPAPAPPAIAPLVEPLAAKAEETARLAVPPATPVVPSSTEGIVSAEKPAAPSAPPETPWWLGVAAGATAFGAAAAGASQPATPQEPSTSKTKSADKSKDKRKSAESTATVRPASPPEPPPIVPVVMPPVFVPTVAEPAPVAFFEPPVATPEPVAEPVVAVSAPVVAPIAPAPEPAPTPAPAIAQPAFESGKDRRVVQDDIDADLLPIFLEEAQEIVPQVGDALRRWRAAPANHTPVTELARHLHTLKGSARMAGLMRLGELAHVMENDVIAMDAEATPATPRFDAVDDGLDRFNTTLARLSKGELAAPIEVPAVLDVSQDLPAPIATLAAARAEIVAEGEKLEGRERQALLRVNADLIDRFVNEAGELAIARSRIDLEMTAFKRALLELSENATRMKQQLREIEIQAETQIQSRTKEAQEHGGDFDPLEFDRFSRMQELTRFVTESLNDVVTLQQSLASNLDETEAALLQQSRLNRELQQGLMSVRLVPLGNLQDRFYRLVRQTAKELDKKANLEFRGVRVEIDRSVLEKITAPLEHLLRNAVSHGLESPAARLSNGKSEIGEITIDAQQVGNEVVLKLADDGSGLNFDRIREKAIQQGLLEKDAEVSDAQLTQYIFMAGFSTAETVTQISGRGVGMDIVRSEILSLGGRIDIVSTRDRGTVFTIALPLTLAVTQAVMVVVGETTYAIPSVMIEQVQEFKGKRYEPLLEMSEIDWKGNKYPLRSLEAMLGGKPTVSAQRKASVILAKSGQQRAAVQVDEIIGNREIVVKTIGPQLARLVGIAGATVMGSGQVILILNPVQLVFREVATVTVETAGVRDVAASGGSSEVTSAATAAKLVAEPALPSELLPGPSLAETLAANMFDDAGFIKEDKPIVTRTVPLVMVVDDSLTVRKITTRMLTREGYEVATAKDGVDALQQLQDIQPDIILLDIEMPRMDGFEFARNVRSDARAKEIPIIMITSRTADKHRNRALELGVNEYMGKPYQEDQLLALIRQYTKKAAAA